MGDFVIGMGANLGAREATLASAASAIDALAHVSLGALSSVYESEPLPAAGPPQPRYLNAAVRVTSELPALALLERLLAIEVAHGRVRTGLRWASRTLDLDILWSDLPVSGAQLQVPHAQLTERTFALAPLLDVAPELAPAYAGRLAALGGAPRRHGRLVRPAWPATGAGPDTPAVQFEPV
ncbi:MAG TPA: 2-amino-4-hydroxy-6-hydroxymethyldihydropteridine diphosphokinase [Polyangiales bacterium]|nr:2-amino-4-hydroxy-6-hydroxymethyldihydropteridine diphosphokinase [Polyangiales bacterium]